MPRAKLDDPHLRDKLLLLIRAGHGRHKAAELVGIAPGTFATYFKNNHDFRDEVEDALNASVEPVLAMLRDEAMAGDMTAAKEFLKHTAPPPRSTPTTSSVAVSVSHGLDPNTLTSIESLRARLEGRQPSLPVIDTEEIPVEEETQ